MLLHPNYMYHDNHDPPRPQMNWAQYTKGHVVVILNTCACTPVLDWNLPEENKVFGLRLSEVQLEYEQMHVRFQML